MIQRQRPPIGATIDELDTPALCLDVDVMQANIAEMVALCRDHGVAWRPHAKGHKSSEIGRRELAAGALGVTCAKLGEAEVMAHGGVTGILIANQIVGPRKLARLVELRRVSNPIVTVDHPDQVEALSSAMRQSGLELEVILEVDIGLNRCGVPAGAAALQLAQQVDRAAGLKLMGIMGYEGHLLALEDLAAKEQQIRSAMAELVATRDLLLRHGLPCPIVSAGGTGSCEITASCPGVTELQAGGLIFMDAFYRQRCQVRRFDFALTLVATVTSCPTPTRAIIDAGRKTHNMEIHPPIVRGRDDLRVEQLSAEHGKLAVDPAGPGVKVGDRLTLIPGYADFTCVLHDEFYVFQQGKLVDIWPLEARGWLC